MRVLLDTCIIVYLALEPDPKLCINEQQGHFDPSDHIIIAHAITEHMPLISSDHKFDFYRNQGLDYICNS